MIGILSIGTEITTGQILNSNTQWLSQELLKLGFSVTHHLTVPDDHKLIFESLQFLGARCPMIFVTGGLGPTADDFTRNVLADFVNTPLEWNSLNWESIVSKLNSKNVQIREIHKNQAFFPKNALILANGAGTADGFYFKTQTPENIEFFVLPGPPKELQNIFSNKIIPMLSDRIPEDQKWIQKIWMTQNLPESDVASKVDEVLSLEESNLVGYRAHKPFVEVKLLYQKCDEPRYSTIATKIESALAQWIVQT